MLGRAEALPPTLAAGTTRPQARHGAIYAVYAMTYAKILLVFGLIPIALLWATGPWVVRRYKGTLLVIVLLVLLVSIPWEMVAIDRLWFYSPRVIWGPRLLRLPLEELAFFIIDGLLVATVALRLGERFRVYA